VLHVVDITRSVVERQARHVDPLTGLADRSALELALASAWRRLGSGSGSGRPITLVFCDLDRFKVLNDTFGHATGDAVLAQIAARLRAVVGGAGEVGRFGGDEFLVLLDDDVDWKPVCRAILAAVAEPVVARGRPVTVTASLGIARADTAEGGPGRLLRQADAALYEAKSAGRGRWHVFQSTSVGGRVQADLAARVAALEGELRIDYLTGIGNKRALDEHLEFVALESRRTGSGFVIAFVDGDRFGAINKSHGQDAGDLVVQTMARVLAGEIRSGDAVFRRGGDEFVVILRDASPEGAQRWLERVREVLAGCGALDGRVPCPITISAGLAAADPADRENPLTVMDRADGAMRRAKAEGGNRISVE